MRYVVYEVWTRARVVEAPTQDVALQDLPMLDGGRDLSLCNWYAIPVPGIATTPPPGALPLTLADEREVDRLRQVFDEPERAVRQFRRPIEP